MKVLAWVLAGRDRLFTTRPGRVGRRPPRRGARLGREPLEGISLLSGMGPTLPAQVQPVAFSQVSALPSSLTTTQTIEQIIAVPPTLTNFTLALQPPLQL